MTTKTNDAIIAVPNKTTPIPVRKLIESFVTLKLSTLKPNNVTPGNANREVSKLTRPNPKLSKMRKASRGHRSVYTTTKLGKLKNET